MIDHIVSDSLPPSLLALNEKDLPLNQYQLAVNSSIAAKSTQTFTFMSTRLLNHRNTNQAVFYSIHKKLGAQGLPYRCDWFIHDKMLFDNVNKTPPKTIFLSVRSPRAFGYFVKELLPSLNKPFVLVVGDSDATFPRGNKDEHFPAMMSEENQKCYQILMKNPCLKACFVENLDKKEDKLTPIPLGILSKDRPINPVKHVDFSDKELKAICIHRIHKGSSWNERLKVNDLCNKHWKDFIYQKKACPRDEFLKTMQTYPFCLCVHGGGIDPSPKAWEALAMGCIPIIERSTLDEAYSRLPVAYIDKWDEHALSKEKLKKWLKRLRPYYEDPNKRAKVIEMLSLDYWWKEILSKTQ